MDHKRQGSMMVEACILLPISIFLIMAMAGAFRFLQLEEGLYYSGFKQMRKSSVEMSLNYSAARVSRLYLEHRIMTEAMEMMGEEQADWIRMTGLIDDGMFFSQNRWDPGSKINCRIYCQWAVGNGSSPGVFSDILRFSGRAYGGENQESVWIFPNWGECYHREGCYVTGGQRLRTVEDAAEGLGYRPCQICMRRGN